MLKDWLEGHQIALYFIVMAVAGAIALLAHDTTVLDIMINPSLAMMLFVTFLQVPLKELHYSFKQGRFLLALLVVNFIVIPLLVLGLLTVFPLSQIPLLGVLMVLLCPCIDYVVTFTHLGKGNARLLLAATPILLVIQIILLPLYLRLFIGESVANLIQLAPFLHAFIGLIVIPLIAALLVQQWATYRKRGQQVLNGLSMLAVPATCLVLFVVIVSVVPQLGLALAQVLLVVPIYLCFSFLAPLLGWLVARLFQLNTVTCRTIAFSGSTRNSLVILPLAFAIPDTLPVLPAIIVAQTLVELISELIYVRVLPRLGQ